MMLDPVKLVFVLLALPVGAALAANAASIGIDDAYGGKGPDADEVLVWASLLAGALVATGVAWRDAKGGGFDGRSLLLGVVAGVITFALSWVPLLVLVTFYPPR
jgi:hypothetical protein